ncbi:MAG: glycosyltransferase family 2 protein [Sandaracinaceae bacterium]
MLEGARVAVVVPAHDEAALIDSTLESIPAFVDAVVVVDDASTDATAARVAARVDPRVTLLRHEVNRGVGAALVTGYLHAFADGADVAAVMAGDGQMDPADLRHVLQPIVRGDADYVKGDRLSHPEVRRRMPPARYVGNRALSRLTRLSTGLDISDSQCGYTALSRDAAEALPVRALWTGYGYPNDLLSRAATVGLRVKDVTVRPLYGSERSGIRIRHLFTVFPYVLARSLARRVTASWSPPPAPPAGRARTASAPRPRV